MVMGLVGFLGVSYPFTPYILSYAPIILLMVEHIRMRPDRYTPIGAPHRGYPHRDTRKTTTNRGTHRGYPKVPNIPDMIYPPP